MAEKNSFIEKGSAFFEKLHYGLGGIAVAGSLIAPEAVAAPLLVFGAYEIAHGGLWTFIKNRAKPKAGHT